MKYSQRYQQLKAQRAYEARVRAFGLVALLEPYRAAVPVSVPEQRKPQRVRVDA